MVIGFLGGFDERVSASRPSGPDLNPDPLNSGWPT